MKSLTPIRDNMLVLLDPPEVMAGTFHLPDIAQTTHVWGEVKAIGAGTIHGLRTGDRVYIKPHLGFHFIMPSPEGGKLDYIVIREKFIEVSQPSASHAA